MPRGDKDEIAETGAARPLGKTADDNETCGDALTRADFVPAKVGHRVVSQGKRRETLKKRASEKPDK